MLVLSRKVNERIVIDGQIEITVCEIEGGRVRLGFVAPRKVSIHRAEVQEAIEDDQRMKGRRRSLHGR